MAVTNDVVKALSKRLGVPTFKARAYLRGATEIIGEGLASGNKVELAGFGNFKLLRLPERTVQTNFNGNKQKIKLAASTSPDFDVDPGLQEQLKVTKSPIDQPVDEQFRTQSLHNRKSDVKFIELVDKTIPRNILTLVPEHIARKYQAVPFALEDKTLFVGMTDPENEEAFNTIRKASGKLVKPFIATQEDVNHILDQYSGLQAEVKELVESSEELETVKEKEEKVSQSEVTETSPAAKIVASLLKRAVRERASDIHIEPSEEDVKVRFRVDGLLKPVLTLPKEIQAAVTSRVKILSSLKIDETRLPQDGRIQILLDGNKIDFRISTLPTVNGEKVVARVLDHSKGVLSFEEIGIHGRALKILEENIKKSHGMTLVTGPTGSGKSTTLYSIINRVKDDTINIITMEDPVEYRMPGVNQSQVNARINFNFSTGLRSILRQDPDVVMVGEIRDKETAEIAVNAALTGHIVLSTLHTNDAVGAIPRLLDMGMEPFLITSSVNSVIAQRLCRHLCDKCKEPVEAKPEELEMVHAEIELMPEPEKSEYKKKTTFYKGKGCSACNNSGYKGRIGIYEIVPMSEPVKVLTLKHANSSELLKQAREEGLITMKQDGIMKVLNGETTIEEVWRVTRD